MTHESIDDERAAYTDCRVLAYHRQPA